MATNSLRYGTDTSRGKAYVAITLVFFVLAMASIGLRVWAKSLRQRAIQLHDYLILAAGFVSCGYLVIAIYGIDDDQPSVKLDLTVTNGTGSRAPRRDRTSS